MTVFSSHSETWSNLVRKSLSLMNALTYSFGETKRFARIRVSGLRPLAHHDGGGIRASSWRTRLQLRAQPMIRRWSLAMVFLPLRDILPGIASHQRVSPSLRLSNLGVAQAQSWNKRINRAEHSIRNRKDLFSGGVSR